jgi:hypothetical protein
MHTIHCTYLKWIPIYIYLAKVAYLKWRSSQAPVAHADNHNYSAGRDQEDQGLKPTRSNSSMRPYFEKTHHKKGLVEWLKA